MPAIFEKIDWKRIKKSKLSEQAVDNLTKADSKPGYSAVAFPEEKNINLDNEDDKMVTSTIVETNSSSSAAVEAAKMANENHNQKFSAIKDASRKEEVKVSSTKKRDRDYSSGMDLLEMDFILGVVEQTAGENEFDVKMRQMCFKELLRRESRHEIASAALKVYAVKGDIYGKDIQCEAMQELTFRTIQNS